MCLGLGGPAGETRCLSRLRLVWFSLFQLDLDATASILRMLARACRMPAVCGTHTESTCRGHVGPANDPDWQHQAWLRCRPCRSTVPGIARASEVQKGYTRQPPGQAAVLPVPCLLLSTRMSLGRDMGSLVMPAEASGVSTCSAAMSSTSSKTQ